MTRFVELHQCGRRIAARTTACDQSRNDPAMAKWAKSFMFAGSSALLLLVANLFADYWYLSFFALTPFLYRVIKATPGESLRLGFLFGLCFFGASIAGSTGVYSVAPAVTLLSGTALFALYGWAVGWGRQRWGFNPAFVALLWVGLEMGLVRLGFVGGLFGVEGFSSPSVDALVGLFGFLAVSAIIVLLNSVLVLAIVKTLGMRRVGGTTAVGDERTWSIFSARNVFPERLYQIPQGRGPPILPETVRV